VQLGVFFVALVLFIWRLFVDRLPSVAERLAAVIILVVLS
jgi:hypothetical protein